MRTLCSRRGSISPVYDFADERDFTQLYVSLFRDVVSGKVESRGTLISVRHEDRVTPFTHVVANFEKLPMLLLSFVAARAFVPICIGTPGYAGEVLQALHENGVWTGSDVSGREQLKQRIAIIRSNCI